MRRLTEMLVTVGILLVVCGGLAMAATMNGSEGDDTLTGTRGPDAISGRGGGDIIAGRGGADRLQGDMGRDRVYAGGGDDVVYADRDLDEDYVDCGPGLDRIEGYSSTQGRDLYLNCELRR